MQCNGNFKQWFNIFLIISEAWQGYELKAYGVLNHNLKLQSKKLSRTRDIPNFPTQGWADTAFCMRNWSETYAIINFKINLISVIFNYFILYLLYTQPSYNLKYLQMTLQNPRHKVYVPNTDIFLSATNSWENASNMNKKRWMPSVSEYVKMYMMKMK